MRRDTGVMQTEHIPEMAITSPLGRGETGAVYRARDTTLKRNVVPKLPTELSTTPTASRLPTRSRSAPSTPISPS